MFAATLSLRFTRELELALLFEMIRGGETVVAVVSEVDAGLGVALVPDVIVLSFGALWEREGLAFV